MIDQLLKVNISSMRYPGANSEANLIQDLSFTVAPESVVSFVGKSGAGKTTLLRMIAGLERRFQGEVILGNTVITKPSRDIQIVFQDYRLLPWKTVYQNIEFALNRNGEEVERDKIDRWLQIIGMKDRRNAWPKTLSGGEEGRVALARTFVSPPKVLLLDEPFRNLDFVAKFELQNELLRDLQTHKTVVVLISHNIDDAVFLSDTVHLLSKAPMKIQASFSVDVPRPRMRVDPRLVNLSTQILNELVRSDSR